MLRVRLRQRNHPHTLYADLGIITLSILFAVGMAWSGALETFLVTIGEWRLIGSFFAGALFTSVFTAPPAVVLLGEMAQANSAWAVALAGACGAVAGDYLIFRFIRDRFSEDILSLLRQQGRRRFRRVLRLSSARWVMGALGLLIIASPLPDEFGIVLLGFSKTSKKFFLPLSFVANFLGILAIGLAAKGVGG